jgi:hypothetical protein
VPELQTVDGAGRRLTVETTQIEKVAQEKGAAHRGDDVSA